MRKKREEQYITITDVAKEAGVSIATVSRVINNGNVRDVKRRAVLDAIKKLNYVPNNSARNLAAVNATKRILLMVPSIGMPCYSELIKGFKNGAQIYKYDPIIQEYDFNQTKYEELNNSLLASSEIKAVVQIGKEKEIANKMVVGLNHDLLKISVDEKYLSKKIGVYFPVDNVLSDFIINGLALDAIDVKEEVRTGINTHDVDFYLCQTIEDAAKLINKGITKDIFVLDNTNELGKIVPNIKTFPIDFFAVGAILAHIAIKSITGVLNDESKILELVIK